MNLIYRNYDSYRLAQIAENARKESFVWATDTELTAIAEHLLLSIRRPEFGICHGCRNGWEIQKFNELLTCPVIGTDIAPGCVYHGLVCHDMHAPLFDCIGKCDFVYTNSFDHCYDLPRFMHTQKRHLTERGWLYLTHSEDKLTAMNEADCLGIGLSELIDAASEHFRLVDVLPLGDIYNASFGATLKGINVVCCKQ